MILSIALSMDGLRAQAATSSSHPLKDLQVFSNTEYGQWAGGGSPLTIETTSNNGLPVDTNVTYNGLPSMRFNITSNGSSGWGWWSMLQSDNWETYSLVPYYANGALEFNIKSAAGGEAFTVSMSDHALRRNPVGYNTPGIQSSTYVTVTADWQHVRIPLKDIIPVGSIFDRSIAPTPSKGRHFKRKYSSVSAYIKKRRSIGIDTIWGKWQSLRGSWQPST